MTDTSQPTNIEEHDEDEDLMPDLYVEKETRMIYECKFFDNFVLVRPTTPKLYLAIRKLNHQQFVTEFEEFCGNKDEVREFIRGATPDFIMN